MKDRPEISMSQMNILLSKAGERRDEITTFLMRGDLFAHLAGDSLTNYRHDVFPFGVLWADIVQAFGRDVIVTHFVSPGAVIGVGALRAEGKPPLIVAGYFTPGEK